MGRNGEPCPFVAAITPGMKPEDRALLIRAWVLRNFPPEQNGQREREQIERLMARLVRCWLQGRAKK